MIERVQISPNVVMNLTKVSPFRILSGNVWKNFTDDSVKLVAAQIVPKKGPIHAVGPKFEEEI